MHEDKLHNEVTTRSGYRYVFTIKHHRIEPSIDSQWLRELSEPEEFSVFECADFHEIADEDGNLYGVLKQQTGLRAIGTRGQIIAEYPIASPGSPWHGYPIWPLCHQKARPTKTVFSKMQEKGLIDEFQRKRLLKGDHPQ